MEENNTTEVENSAEAATETEAANEVKVYNIDFGGVNVEAEGHAKKKRGKEEYLSVVVPRVKTLDQLLAIASFVGEENFVATITRDILRDAFAEASAKAFTDTGFNDVLLCEDIKSFFDPRKAKERGPKKAEILERQAGLATELTELLTAASEGNWGEAEKNRLLSIKLEMAQLGEALAKKTRRGKAPKSEKAAKKA